MSIFSQMWERVFSARRDENRKKNPRSRLARLERLEERQLLTVAPGVASETAIVSEAPAVTNDDALATAEALDVSTPADDVYFVANESNGSENTAIVAYLDYDVESGRFVQKSVEAMVVDAAKDGGWTSGWYVVRGSITMKDADVWCNGDVRLILEDGCNLTIQAKDDKAGFACADNTACSLTIYGQSGGTGELHVTGGDDGAGIGGVDGCGGRGITINGGRIYAQGGERGAGIGGGYKGSGYNITINGGYVEARGGTDGDVKNGDGGAGIGGGNKGVGSNITIREGEVHAYGGANAAGVGGGEKKNGENITITGGTVEAHGGYRGAGIGGGGSGNVVISAGSGKNITISGGTVRAFGGDGGGAGIGGGEGRWSAPRGHGQNISITGGTVEARGGSGGCCIGDGNKEKGSNITIYREAWVKTGDDSGSARTFVNGGGDLSESLGNTQYVSVKPRPQTSQESVSYLDRNGDRQEVTATVVEEWMNTEWEAGWYVVKGDVTISDAGVRTIGDVKLILTDGCCLTVTGMKDRAGFGVSQGSLTIYAQTTDVKVAGTLKATGGCNGAGIGGGYRSDGANIEINGGNIQAQGGEYAAGVGGGGEGAGSNITINGGYVSARGGTKQRVTTLDAGGAGIGGGFGGKGTNITITDGDVHAYGGANAAGIGGGEKESGENITITGGTVEARGQGNGAGIGGGGGGTSEDYFRSGDGRRIKISGGTVRAFGGDRRGAGIGGGNGYSGGLAQDISITGGTVEAVGDNDGHCIGDGGCVVYKIPDRKICVTVNAVIKVGANAGSATRIANDGGDLTYAFASGQYAKIETSVQLAAPESFAATSTTDDSVAVSWDEVENASGYQIEYRVKGSKDKWTVLDLNDTSFEIDSLKPNTTYRVRVKAIGVDGYSDSTYVKFNVTTEKATLTSVSISGTAKVGATLTATVAPDDATATYAWYRSGVSEPVGTGATYEVSTEDVGAFLTVKATGADDYTGVVFASTEVFAPVQQLAKPKKFQTTSTTDDSITVSWKAVDNADGYQIEYRVKGSGKKWTVLETEDTTITVDGLKSDRTYRIRVKAVGSGACLDSNYAKLDATTDEAFAFGEDEAIPTGTVATNAWNLFGFVGVVAPVAAVEVAQIEAPTFARSGKVAETSDVRSEIFATFEELDLDVAFDTLV